MMDFNVLTIARSLQCVSEGECMFYRYFVAFIARLCIICIALVFLRTDHTCRHGFESLIL